MKITVLGGGNMGGAIAAGVLSAGLAAPQDVCVTHPRGALLQRLEKDGLSVRIETDNARAAEGADFVFVAVKPWLAEGVLREIAPALEVKNQAVASVVAGLPFVRIKEYLGASPALFRVIPNTAVSIGLGTTFVSQDGATEAQTEQMMAVFDALGKAFLVPEEQMTAVTALCSCGIAYILRYIGAAVDGAARLGLDAQQALPMVLQTVRGAVGLLETNGTTAQQEIDKVTTPGGITLKGLEAMERGGFSEAVIQGLLASK